MRLDDHVLHSSGDVTTNASGDGIRHRRELRYSAELRGGAKRKTRDGIPLQKSRWGDGSIQFKVSQVKFVRRSSRCSASNQGWLPCMARAATETELAMTCFC